MRQGIKLKWWKFTVQITKCLNVRKKRLVFAYNVMNRNGVQPSKCAKRPYEYTNTPMFTYCFSKLKNIMVAGMCCTRFDTVIVCSTLNLDWTTKKRFQHYQFLSWSMVNVFRVLVSLELILTRTLHFDYFTCTSKILKTKLNHNFVRQNKVKTIESAIAKVKYKLMYNPFFFSNWNGHAKRNRGDLSE